jgi:hypothetical protein
MSNIRSFVAHFIAAILLGCPVILGAAASSDVVLPSQGIFTTFNSPGSIQTRGIAINNRGVIGGHFLDSNMVFWPSQTRPGINTLSLYDDFSEGLIDPSKWAVQSMCGDTGYDCAREVRNGRLRLAVKGYGSPYSDSGISFANSQVDFRNPNSIDAIQVGLNVKSFLNSGCPANSDAGGPQLALHGVFFNTGTGDASGDMHGMLLVNRSSDETFDAPGLLRVFGLMSLNGQFFNFADLGTLQTGEAARATLLWDRPNHTIVVRIVKSLTTPSVVEQSMPYAVPDNQPPFALNNKFIAAYTFAPNCTAQRNLMAMDAKIDNVRVHLVDP